MPGLHLGLGLGLQRHSKRASGPAPDPLAISGTPVLTATEGVAYAGFTVSASGGTAPYTYSLVGTWPAGISINASTGAVSGTPTESGSFTGLSVRVTDAVSATDDLAVFALDVAAGAAQITAVDTMSAISANPTFSGKSFGAAAADRILFALVGYDSANSGSAAFSSVTIGGVTATKIVERSATGTANCAWFMAAVPSGTTGDVVVALSVATLAVVSVSLLRATGISTTVSDTGGATVGGATVSAMIDCPADGIIVAGLLNSSAPDATTWTNIAELTDFGDVDDNRNSAAGQVYSTQQTNLSISAGPTAGGTKSLRLVAASFGPA